MADNVTMQPKNLAPINGGYDKNLKPFAAPTNSAASFKNLTNSVTEGDIARLYKASGISKPKTSSSGVPFGR